MSGAHCQTSYEVLLMEYAAGTLDLAQQLIVAAHLSFSPEARRIVRDCECVGGALIESGCEPVAMRPDSFESVMSRIGPPEAGPREQRARAAFPDDIRMPGCVDEYITCRPGRKLQWKALYPGVHSFALPLECRRSAAHVFRFDPGRATPRHGHGGLELTLVLDGAFEDESGLYRQGSLLVMDENAGEHSPQACEEKGCVCITVFTGDIRMSSPLLRLLSPFLRF